MFKSVLFREVLQLDAGKYDTLLVWTCGDRKSTLGKYHQAASGSILRGKITRKAARECLDDVKEWTLAAAKV